MIKLPEEHILVLLELISFTLLENEPFASVLRSESAIQCWNKITPSLLTSLDECVADNGSRSTPVGWKIAEVILQMILVCEERDHQNTHLQYCIEDLNLLSGMKSIILFSAMDPDAPQMQPVKRLMAAAIELFNHNGFSASIASAIG